MKWTYIDGSDRFPPLIEDRIYLVKYENGEINHTLAYYDIDYLEGYGPRMPLSGSFFDIDKEEELQNVIAWCDFKDVISHLDMQQENRASPLETRTYFKIQFHSGTGCFDTEVYWKKYDTAEEAEEEIREYLDISRMESFDILEIKETVILKNIRKDKERKVQLKKKENGK